MWPQRIVDRIIESSTPVILHEANEGAGSFVAQALREHGPVAWLRLAPGLRDEIKVGTRLATVLRHALNLEEYAFGTGTTYHYVIEQFRPYTNVPGAFFLVVDDAEQYPKFTEAVLSLDNIGCRVIVINRGFSASLKPEKSELVLDHETLRLTYEEVLEVERGYIPLEVQQEVWEEFKGRPFATKARLAEVQGLEMVVPEPDPLISDEGTLIDPSSVVQKLVAGREYKQAFFHAARYAPSLLPSVLRMAGPAFFKEGGFEPMFRILNAMQPEHRNNDAFIFWLAQAARRTSRLIEVREEIFQYCFAHDHPEALTITTIHSPDLPAFERKAYLDQARKSEKRDFYTHLYGYHLDTSGSVGNRIAWIEQAFLIAHRRNEDTLLVDAHWERCVFEVERGDYGLALDYLMKAWDIWNDNGFSDEYTRLTFLNCEIYLSMMVDKQDPRTQEFLNLPLNTLPESEMRLQEILTTTKIEYFLWRQDARQAEEVGWKALDNLHILSDMTWRIPELIATSLRQQGKMDAAYNLLKETERKLADTRAQMRMALIAELSFITTDPERTLKAAESYFAQNDQVFHTSLDSVGMAITYLYLMERKTGQLRENLVPESIMSTIRNINAEGLRIFVAPYELVQPTIERIMSARTGIWDGMYLEVCSAHPKVTWDGDELSLSRREVEALFLLSVNEGPLTYAQLHTLLYREGVASAATVRKLIHRLRRLVPITTDLRLNIRVHSDYLDVLSWLNDAPGGAAPQSFPILLSDSISPQIEELRERIMRLVRAKLMEETEVNTALAWLEEILDLDLLEQLQQQGNLSFHERKRVSERIALLGEEYSPV